MIQIQHLPSPSPPPPPQPSPSPSPFHYHCAMLIRVNSLDGLNEVAEYLISLFDKDFKVVLLEGELGAGKTTLVKALCQLLGVMEPVSSPTFSLVQEYESPSRGIIYHMDFYRLENSQDLDRIGFDEYLDTGNVCLIEWPGVGKSYYTMPHILVGIESGNDNIRNFRITTNDTMDT